MRCRTFPLPALLAFFAFLSLLAPLRVYAQSSQTLYDDALQNGWDNWSWATVDMASTEAAYQGSRSVKVTITGGYQALYLHHSAFDTTNFVNLTFWINGGSTNGRSLGVAALLSGNAKPAVNLNTYVSGGSVVANAWRQVTIPLSALGVDKKSDLTGFWVEDVTGGTQPAFYVDAITLTADPPPAVVNLSVDAGNTIRTVDNRLFGLNAAVWDSQFHDNPTGTTNLLTSIDNRVLRFPGGSTSDGYHWRTGQSEGSSYVWANTFDDFAGVAHGSNAQTFITVNYGSGTAQEAADWVTYSNVTKKYGFRYWEIGNEVYGTWEYDTHAVKNDPYTYAVQAKDYITRMRAADPTIKVGVVVETGEDSYVNNTSHPATNPRTQAVHNGWTPVMLTTLKSLGVTPDFVIYHRYEQGPGGENDAGLLQAAGTWKNDAADLRQQLGDYLGAPGAGVELVVTENNSVSYNPGKQTTSLVNALYLADSLGNLLQTEINANVWWDLRNGQDGSQNNSTGLYGWRQYGDYGITSGNDLYPTYYGFKLLSKFARGGDTVVSAVSDYSGLAVYAAKRLDGTLTLLVINKTAANALVSSVKVAGYVPQANATVFTYGIPQDEAVRTGTGSPDLAQTTISNAGTMFSATFAPYSATVIALSPVPTTQTLRPTADTFVRASSFVNTNYGSKTLLTVRKYTNGANSVNNQCAYLKFDLTGVTVAPRSATLTLTVDGTSSPVNRTAPVKVYSVSDTTWTETGLTWNNAPGLNRTTFVGTGSLITQKNVTLVPSRVTFDLTAFVAANRGHIVTLQLIDETTDNLYLVFHSRNHTSGQPTLSLNF